MNKKAYLKIWMGSTEKWRSRTAVGGAGEGLMGGVGKGELPAGRAALLHPPGMLPAPRLKRPSCAILP